MLELIAQSPALPLDEAGKYVAGAYGVFVVMILVYVGIMAVRLRTLEKDALELLEAVESADADSSGSSLRELPDAKVKQDADVKQSAEVGS